MRKSKARRWSKEGGGAIGVGRRLVPYVYVVGVDVVPLLSFDVGLWQEVDPGVVICRGQRSEVTKKVCGQ